MVKGKEWLKEEIWYSDRNIGLDWKEFVLNLIDQLDEPEVLSKKRLRETLDKERDKYKIDYKEYNRGEVSQYISDGRSQGLTFAINQLDSVEENE